FRVFVIRLATPSRYSSVFISVHLWLILRLSRLQSSASFRDFVVSSFRDSFGYSLTLFISVYQCSSVANSGRELPSISRRQLPVHGVEQRQPGRLPAPLNGSLGDAQELRCLGLRQPLIP